MMFLIARLSRLISEVHIQQTLGFGLVELFRQGNLRGQNVAGLGKHALLTCGQTMLVDITLGEIAHHFGDLIDVASGDLLDV